MKTALHYLRINALLILFLVAAFTLSTAVVYAMLNTFGAYALIFVTVAVWIAYCVTNFHMHIIFGE